MTVGSHCQRNPVTVGPKESIRDAARRMDSKGVGCVLVVDDDDRLLGVLTDRDVVTRGLGKSRDLEKTPVSTLMSKLPLEVREVTPVARAIIFMRNAHVRRLPVVDQNGRLTGIFTHDDALKIVARNLSAATEAIEAQFPSRADEPIAQPEESWELPMTHRYRLDPVVARENTPIRAVVDMMEERGVGCVVVVDEKRIPVGVVTDRDLMRRVVVAGADVNSQVGKVMSPDVLTLPEEASLQELLELARARRIRRVPLVNESGELAGVVALNDVIAALSTELEELSHALRPARSREADTHPPSFVRNRFATSH